jgi:hypothetical protein
MWDSRGRDDLTAMSAPLPTSCPRCGKPMEVGFLYLDHHRTSWLRERPEHVWQGDFSDHLGPKTTAGLVNYPGFRCRDCQVILFVYRSG